MRCSVAIALQMKQVWANKVQYIHKQLNLEHKQIMLNTQHHWGCV